jgi:hypothetical protein
MHKSWVTEIAIEEREAPFSSARDKVCVRASVPDHRLRIASPLKHPSKNQNQIRQKPLFFFFLLEWGAWDWKNKWQAKLAGEFELDWNGNSHAFLGFGTGGHGAKEGSPPSLGTGRG